MTSEIKTLASRITLSGDPTTNTQLILSLIDGLSKSHTADEVRATMRATFGPYIDNALNLAKLVRDFLPESKGLQIACVREIEWQRVGDMICGALEGNACVDWIQSFHAAQDDLSPTVRRSMELLDAKAVWYYEGGVYWRDGGKAVITYEDGTNDGYQQKPFGRDDIERGLALMAEKSPNHFNDLVSENDDAITSDVFMQYCVLGEIVFG